MAKRLILIIMILFFITTNSLVSGSRLKLDSAVINLGKIPGAVTTTILVRLTNIGNEPLHIKQIQPSCGCTTIKMPNEVIYPGTSDSVELKFNSAGMKGRVQKHVLFTTNDPVEPTKQFTFIADVINDFEIIRYGTNVYLGTRVVGKKFDEMIGFRNISGRTIVMDRISTSSKSMKVTAQKRSVAAGDTAWVKISALPMKEGFNSEEFMFKTNSVSVPRTIVKINYKAVKQ